MSDTARPSPPGQEKAHGGNAGLSNQKPAGQELGTVKNGDAGHNYGDLAR